MRLIAASAITVCAASCAPAFDVAIDWTIDGADAAAVCSALPAGTDIGFDVSSRDNADPRFGGPVTETTASAVCGDGTATIQTGPFAEIGITLRNGDVVIGSAGTVAVSPGSASNGFVDKAPRARADITLLQGRVTATLTVAGRSCGDAGASSFTVTLSENTQPNINVAVDGAVDVVVPCTGGVATFTHEPVNVGSPHFIQATTDIGGVTFTTSSSGEGFTAAGPNTAVVVDLQSR